VGAILAFHGRIEKEDRMTFAWFIVWLITNNIGGHNPLELDPVNFWTATLILAAAIDLNRPRYEFKRRMAKH
jgi:hypothetical protein